MPARSKRAPTLAPSIAAHRVERKSLADLQPATYNPRRISKSARAGLESSLKRFGYVDLIVWNERTGVVVGGHQRLDVLRAGGVTEVDVVVVDLPEADEKALNVALNNPHIGGEFDETLADLLAEIRSADEMLFQEMRLDQLLAEAERARTGLGDPDAVPEPPGTPQTQRGDLYELGAHRLLCGDSTITADVARLFGDELVDQMVTDPPYGVDYGDEAAQDFKRILQLPPEHRKIENDAGQGGDYAAWFQSWLTHTPWRTPSCYHIFMSGQELHNLRAAADALGYHWGDHLVWVKDRLVFGRKDYKPKHEFVMYRWATTHRFYGPTNRSTILEFDRPSKSELHPTMKPVELLEQLLTDGSAPGMIVYDPFAGSGSTIVARWEAFTDKTATRHRAPD